MDQQTTTKLRLGKGSESNNVWDDVLIQRCFPLCDHRGTLLKLVTCVRTSKKLLSSRLRRETCRSFTLGTYRLCWHSPRQLQPIKREPHMLMPAHHSLFQFITRLQMQLLQGHPARLAKPPLQRKPGKEKQQQLHQKQLQQPMQRQHY